MSFLQENVLSFQETMKRVRDQKLNLARFGNTELDLVVGRAAAFQPRSPELSERLSQALLCPNAGCMVALPPSMPRGRFWRPFWARTWGPVRVLLENSHGRPFGNAFVTRPEAFLRNNFVETWRELFRGRTLTVVTGEHSRFYLEHELFGEAKTINFIYSLSHDAFSDYERLAGEILNDDAEVTLLALGATGTVLANEFADTGKWVLDVGHLPNSYATAVRGWANPSQQPFAP